MSGFHIHLCWKTSPIGEVGSANSDIWQEMKNNQLTDQLVSQMIEKIMVVLNIQCTVKWTV